MNGGPGDIGSYRVIDYKKADDGKEVAYGGDGWVFAVEFGDIPVAKSVLVYGQSEREDAAHATDQVESFIEGKLKNVIFTEEDVEAGTVRRYAP
jgi:acyl-homoserine-lactone acylase